MYFITALNDVITGIHCGDINVDFYGQPYYGHDRIEVPRIDGIRVLDLMKYYTPEWERKSDCRLIDEGLIPMPKTYVREGDSLRAMTLEERIIAGIDKPQPGCKVADGKIVPMTLSEQLAVGQVTQEEYKERMSLDSEAELERRLAILQTPKALAQTEVDEEYAAKRKKQLVVLLAVRKQSGWPCEVDWPAE